MIAKFDGLIEPRRCVDMKGIVTSEIGPNRFTTFEKQAQVATTCSSALSCLT